MRDRIVLCRGSLLAVLLLLLGFGPFLAPASAAAAPRVLFDNSHDETAGNADWIISTSQPDPLQENSAPGSESDWTGALSAWGVSLQQAGFTVNTLPENGTLSYSDSGNDLDLSNVDVLVLPEPNVLFTDAEKTAIMQFVRAGGGLFMISDHHGSDRDNDGADSVDVLNDLMTANSVDAADPFGFSIDVADIPTDDPDGISDTAAGDPIIDGSFGRVSGTIIRSGTTATIAPDDNAAVRAEIFRSSADTSGTSGVAFASSGFGSGRVAFWGDSSPIDDGSGQSGNDLYDGWNDPAGTDAALALNATTWLARTS